MTEIITFKDKTPLVSHEVLERGFGLKERSMSRLIRNNSSFLEKFGDIVIGGIPNPGKHGGHNKKEYLLNEEQAMFVMTLTRSTKETLDFRFNLIKEFSSMKKSLVSAENLLMQSLKLLDENKAAGSNWGRLGSKIKQERKPILESIESANKLLQIELKFN